MTPAQLSAMANRFKPAIEPKPVVKLDKCEYSIFIHTELTKLYSSDDFWSSFRSHALNDLQKNEEEIAKAIKTEDESNANVQKLNKFTADYQTFSISFYQEYPKDYCKEGFNDFTSMAFVKYSDADLFSKLKQKYTETSKIPCAAFEDKSVCSDLPAAPNMRNFMGLVNIKVCSSVDGEEI